MRLLFLAGMLALTACSGATPLTGDAKAVHELCTSAGGAVAYCDCSTKELQAKLTPEIFAEVAKGETGSDPSALLEIMAAADKVCTKT